LSCITPAVGGTSGQF